MSERYACAVPGCRRTILARRIYPHDSWICDLHWRSVARGLKSRYRRMKRGLRTERDPARKLRRQRMCVDLWKRCVVAAIEAAAGIG